MAKLSIGLPEHGFVGSLFDAGDDDGTAVVVLTGSDGGLAHAEYIASLFAARGIAALALACFKYPGLSKTLSMIPVEYIERATRWLKLAKGYGKVALYGVSKGAEYSLVASSLIRDIECVVAVVPSYYVAEGIGAGKSLTGTSSWSYRGRQLPYVPIPGSSSGLIKSFLCSGQMELVGFYEMAERRGIPQEAIIPVEESRSRILLLSSGQDSVWPSRRAGELIAEKLRSAGYAFPYRHQCYEQCSHILDPVPAAKERLYRLLFKAERRDPKGCHAARQDAFREAIEWIEAMALAQ